MSSPRLFRFPKPQWLNSPNTRTAGVYFAGALVRPSLPTEILSSISLWHLPLFLPPPSHPPNPHLIKRHPRHPTDQTFSQFSLGFFFFIDAACWSHSGRNNGEVHVTFVDWIPGICSALGMLVINSIEKARLSDDSYSYSGSGNAWKARVLLFLGFALLAGGVAGSVVGASFFLMLEQ
jgi:hypothetical protein